MQIPKINRNKRKCTEIEIFELGRESLFGTQLSTKLIKNSLLKVIKIIYYLIFKKIHIKPTLKFWAKTTFKITQERFDKLLLIRIVSEIILKYF